jgi:hypothetical protein
VVQVPKAIDGAVDEIALPADRDRAQAIKDFRTVRDSTVAAFGEITASATRTGELVLVVVEAVTGRVNSAHQIANSQVMHSVAKKSMDSPVPVNAVRRGEVPQDPDLDSAVPDRRVHLHALLRSAVVLSGSSTSCATCTGNWTTLPGNLKS